MAKNLGREFATMDEDQRRRFAMTPEGGTDAAPAELDFDNPRNEEEADAGDVDGAPPDDAAHRAAAARQPKDPPDAA